jgi:hypothetical protein
MKAVAPDLGPEQAGPAVVISQSGEIEAYGQRN